MTNKSKAVILPLVLAVLLLIGLLAGMFAFRVNADLTAMQAVSQRIQTRLAAEAGIDYVKRLLPTLRLDKDLWYHNPKQLHRIIVWADGVDPQVLGTNEELDKGALAYRFSIVADDLGDDEKFIRIGLTDESSKLNLNTATEAQLSILVTAAAGDNQEFDIEEIVSAILDWRDSDNNSRGKTGDTEAQYYRTLDRPYHIKNGPFDTVEELLLVKGVTGQLLYGEDFDRNGLLGVNEDDGDLTFPPDNEDNRLNKGLYAYLTVWSVEAQTSNDNRPRINLFDEESTVSAALELEFPDEPTVVNYIVSATRGQDGGRGAGNATNRGQGGNSNTGGDGSGGSPEDVSPDAAGSTDNDDRNPRGKLGPQQQVREEGEAAATADETQEGVPNSQQADDDLVGDESGENQAQEGQETNDAQGGLGPIETPAALLLQRETDSGALLSPMGVEHLAILMDRTTVVQAGGPGVAGLINVNTAPGLVLRCINGLTDEQIKGILETRDSLSAEDQSTTAWLVTEKVLDLETYVRIAPQITARGQQFTIDSLGFADHVGMVTRLQVVVDMVGPIAQTIYYRDLTKLGAQFPIREEDKEYVRAR